MSAPDIIWRPNADFLENSHAGRLMRRLGFSDVREFLAWSVADIRRFWKVLLEDMGMEWYRPYDEVLDLSGGFPWARWFVGGETNIVLNCIDRHARGPRRDRTALVWEGDGGEVRRLTYGEFSAEVSRLANAMRAMGMKPGETAGLFMPMSIEGALAMYACFKIGVAMIPVFSGFGPEGLAERLIHAKARLVFTSDEGVRRGKPVPVKATVDAAITLGAKVEKVVVHRRTGAPVPMQPGRDVAWEEFTAGQPVEAETTRLPADAVSLILYTSGTTGRPKGTVHTHPGLLCGPGREARYCLDLREGELLFWVADFGWVMAPYALIGAHFNGQACLLYEGVPNHPGPGRLWEIVERHRVTHLGISPTAIRLLISTGEEWVRKHDLSSLRVLGSTGEPWDPDSYMWYFRNVGGGRCPIMNISGGTEIGGCLLQPLPVMELAPCTLGMPPMGTDTDVFDDEGRPVRGEVGHLVLKQPIPSLTRGFLNDPERYLETYFSRWPEVWYHGDWAKADARGLWYLYGRSDDTIKVAGKRVGPSEVEAELLKHPGVVEAAAVGTPHPIKGEGLTCFVVLAAGHPPSDALREELKDLAVQYLGKSLRPDEVKFVRGLPKTRSAKIVRGAIRKIHLGEEISHMDLSSLDSPEHLQSIREAI
ncbi:MAG: AMP-binding protein [Nitrospinota bacterium]